MLSLVFPSGPACRRITPPLFRTIAYLFALLALLLTAQAATAQNISGSYTILPDPGAINHTVAPRMQDATIATDFCSYDQQTNQADATQCLQNAINAICNLPAPGTRPGRGGGTLFIPAGTYLVKGTVSIPCSGVQILGSGIGDRDNPNGRGTEIMAALDSDRPNPADPVFKTTATVWYDFAFGFSIKDLTIFNQGNARTGPFVQLDGMKDSSIENVYFFAPCTAIRINGGNGIHVRKVRSESSLANCEDVQVTGSPAVATPDRTTTDVVSFEDVKIDLMHAAGSTCYRISDRVQTVWWKNTTCETQAWALRSTCAPGIGVFDCPGFFTLYDFEAESFGNGYNLIDITDLVDGFKMTDSWLRGRTATTSVNDLISILPLNYATYGNLMVNISSSWLKYAGRHCVNVNSDNVAITGNQIFGCNYNYVGGVGVNLTSHRATLTANQFCGQDWLGGITGPMGGVLINPGSDYVTLTGNVFSGNVGSGNNNGCNLAYLNNSGAPAAHFAATGNVGP